MHYIVYKTTNQVNGKFYIGTHKTVDLNDDYLGSGTLLRRAIEKYGIENFKKEILFVYDNPEDMFAKEAEIVNEDFLSENNTYNLKKGGFGGFDYINSEGLRGYASFEKRSMGGKTSSSRLTKEHYRNMWKNSYESRKLSGKKGTFEGKRHSSISIEKIKLAASGKHKGSRNSQYGTIWITNLKTLENKKIPKNDTIPDGWIRGRKIKSCSPIV